MITKKATQSSQYWLILRNYIVKPATMAIMVTFLLVAISLFAASDAAAAASKSGKSVNI
jgi:hypothetical protein